MKYDIKYNMSMMIANRLKGCNSEFINEQVDNVLCDIGITEQVKTKVIEILQTYSIIDCMKIIKQFGSVHDAFLRYNANINVNENVNSDENANISAKILFHRNLTYSYLSSIIHSKINEKVRKQRHEAILKTTTKYNCSICLYDIEHRGLFVTRCGHVFHKHCIRLWGINKSCPDCMQHI
jgi:hypothetical protein